MSVDVRYINPFIGAIKNVFETMLDTQVLISKPRVKKHDELSADVSAVIGFSGEAAGSVALCFSTTAGLRTAGKFAGMDVTERSPELADALGELANMVAGQAKSKLEGLNINVSLPRVIIGHELRLLDSSENPVLVLSCDSPLGRFNTEVAMIFQRPPSSVSH